MGDYGEQLGDIAKQIAESAKHKQGFLEIEHAELQRKRADAKIALDVARGAHQRLLNFSPTLGADFQCPNCWITDARHSALHPVSSDTGDDMYHCDNCHLDFVLRP
jgi:hypothetical protein